MQKRETPVAHVTRAWACVEYVGSENLRLVLNMAWLVEQIWPKPRWHQNDTMAIDKLVAKTGQNR